MDLLFEKMANPFVLIDELLLNGDFFDWVLEFINAENDRQIWEVWLYKIFDKSFEDFKNSIVQQNQMDDEQLETTVMDSKSILNGFIPN
jgi:hypothetical protein